MPGKFQFNRIVWDKKMVAAVAILTVALLYGDIAFLVRMQLQGLSTMGPKLKQLKKDIFSLNKDLAQMRMAQEEALRQKGEPLMVKKLINAESFPTLLDKISVLGNTPGIKIMQLQFVKEEAQAVIPVGRPGRGQPPPAAPAPAQNKGDNFSTWIVSMDLACEYHKLGVFLNQLDELPAVFYVQGLKIFPDGNRQTANVEIKAYVNK